MRFRSFIWVLAVAFFMYQGIAAATLFTLPLLFVAAAMQLAAGVLVDLIGVRRVFIFAAVMMAIGGVVFAFSYDTFSLETGRYLIGVGASVAFVGFIMATNRCLPERYLATFIGLGISLATVCKELSALYSGAMEALWGWRPVVFVIALIGAAFTFLFRALKGRVYFLPARATLAKALSRRDNWLITLALLCFYPIITVFQNIPPLVLGFIVGTPLIGLLSDYIGRRKVLLLVFQLITLIAFVLNLYFPSFILLTLLGFSAAGVNLFYPLILEANPKGIQATALGFAIATSFFGALFVNIFASFEIFPTLLVLSIMATLLLKEPRKKKENAAKVLDRLLEKVDEIQKYRKTG